MMHNARYFTRMALMATALLCSAQLHAAEGDPKKAESLSAGLAPLQVTPDAVLEAKKSAARAEADFEISLYSVQEQEADHKLWYADPEEQCKRPSACYFHSCFENINGFIQRTIYVARRRTDKAIIGHIDFYKSGVLHREQPADIHVSVVTGADHYRIGLALVETIKRVYHMRGGVQCTASVAAYDAPAWKIFLAAGFTGGQQPKDSQTRHLELVKQHKVDLLRNSNFFRHNYHLMGELCFLKYNTYPQSPKAEPAKQAESSRAEACDFA